MNTPTHAVILVAGRGTRLAPLTDTQHKSLLILGGMTILERQISQLMQQNIDQIVLVTGHREDDLRAYLKGAENFGADITIVRNDNFQQTNTAYSLGLALEKFSGSFLLLDGDVVMSDPLVKNLIAAGENTLLCECDPAKLNDEAVKVRVDTTGKVLSIGKQVPLAMASGESIGVGFFGADWRNVLQEDCVRLRETPTQWNWYYEDVIRARMRNIKPPASLKIVQTAPYEWVEVDDHEDLCRAKKIFG